ncbi:MAG: FMN-dependent NADH-azoreductase [Paracoccaceae bacterium]
MSTLVIDASARADASVSRKITAAIAQRLGGPVVHRDLAATVPPLVTEPMIGAYFTPAPDRSAAQSELIAASDEIVAELRAADTVVIGLPIYNFGVPAALKAWADLAGRVGETFRYTETGPVGLLRGKRAILAVASGGTQVDSPIDFATPWMRQFLGFIGITDVTVIAADALGAQAEAKIAEALEEARALAA